MKAPLTLIVILFLSKVTLCQIACDPSTGSAKPNTLPYTLNPYKNRTTAPTKVNPISLNNVLAEGNDTNRFKDSEGAVIEGYVISTKLEGKESCNCESMDPSHRDFHIYIARSPTETNKAKMMVVEVTPKVRAIKGSTWSRAKIAKLKGHKVKFTGWLFFDQEHENVALNTNPNGQTIERATVWEIHPITEFAVVE